MIGHMGYRTTASLPSSCRRCWRSWAALIRRSEIQVVALLVFTGCPGLSSTHPALPLANSEPIPEHLLGTWQIVELFGEPGDPLPEVVVSRGPEGSLAFVMRHGSQTMSEGEASVTILQGQTILSTEAGGGPEESWLLLLLSFDEEQQMLEVTSLGHAEVVEDIDQGLVEGIVFKSDGREFASLKAPTEQLRAYLASHQDVLVDELMVLRKKTP